MKMLGVTLMICILLTGLHAWEEKHCTGADVARCLSPFSHYLNKSNDVLFPNYDVETMHDLCSDYEEVKECLWEVKLHCREIVQTVFTGLEESYAYLCSSHGLEVYKRTEDCLSRPLLQQEGHKCISKFELETAHVTITRALGGNAYMEEFCRVANTYFHCLHDVIEAECGREAAQWQGTVIKDALRETLRLLDCRIDGEWTEGEIIFVSVMIGTIFMISAAPVIMHVYTKYWGPPPESQAEGANTSRTKAGVPLSQFPPDLFKGGGSQGFQNPGFAKEHGSGDTLTL